MKKEVVHNLLNPSYVTEQQLGEIDGEYHLAQKNDIPSNQITFNDLVLILWRGKYLIIACTFLAIIFGVIYALTATEIFSTSSHFIVKTGGKNNNNLSQLAAMAGVNIGNSKDADPSDFLDKVIQDKDFISVLLEKKWFFKNDTLPLEKIFKIKADTTLPNWEYIFLMTKVEKIRKGKVFFLRKDAKTGLLTLSTFAPDPKLAYDLNIFILNYLSDYIRNSIKTQAKEKRIFIEERIRETKLALERSEDALAQFRGSNLMASSPQVLIEEARLLRQVTMNQEIYIQFQKQYELARIEELDDQTLIMVVMKPEIPIFRSKPKRVKIVAVFLLIGITFGFISSYLLFYGKNVYKILILPDYSGKSA